MANTTLSYIHIVTLVKKSQICSTRLKNKGKTLNIKQGLFT